MLLQRIFGHAQSQPRKVAIHESGYRVTYAEFAHWIAGAREFLANQQLRAGSVAILLDLTCKTDNWVFLLALRSLGLHTVAVPGVEALDEIGLRNIGCVITPIRDQPIRIAAGGPGCKIMQIPRRMFLGKSMEGTTQAPNWEAPMGGHILVTSGTTGKKRKSCSIPPPSSIIARRQSEVYFISPESVVNVFHFPIWTGGGYKIPAAAWSEGGTAVFYEKADPHRSLHIDGITHAVCTPASLSQILKAPAAEIRKNPDMKLIVSAAPLTAALATAARESLTPQIYTVVASTEVGPWALTRIEDNSDLGSHDILDSADVEIVDTAGNLLAASQTGAIRIRTPEQATGYLGDPTASAEVFRQGYFHPGDVGCFRQDGRLVLQGRASSVLNVMGDKIGAEPIEQELQEKLPAEAVCLLSIPGAAIHEELHAVIQTGGRLDAGKVAALIAGFFPGIPTPHVHMLKEIPRNELGKVDRLALKEIVAAMATATRN